MSGINRGRGIFLTKPTTEDDENKAEDSDATSSIYPILGRGRGLASLTPSTFAKSSDSLSEAGSSTSSFPLLGRGRAALSQLRIPRVESKSSESEIQIEKATEQFTEIPEKKSLSFGRGRAQSSGHGSNEKDLPKTSGSKTSSSDTPAKSFSPTRVFERQEEEIFDEEETEQVEFKHGTKGTPYTAMTNCITLKCNKDFGVFEYEVRFNPEIDNMQQRYKYLNQLKDKIGNTRNFDGVTLYLPTELPSKLMSFETPLLNGQGEVTVKISYRRKKRLGECIHLYNVLFERIMRILNYQRIGRKCFDPTSPKFLDSHKLEIWPGYVKSVEEYEGGLMLLLDVSHRVLSKTTVLQYMEDCYNSKSRVDPSSLIKKGLIGHVVLTRYNNKSYRIDDIAFDKKPTDTFMHGDKEIQYLNYYKQNYEITIQNTKQPLLIHRKQVRIAGEKEKRELTFCLIPELCYLTGLTDEMRNSFTMMRDLASHTKLSPYQRVAAYKKFIDNINGNPNAKQLLLDWGLELEADSTKVNARVLENECIIFGRGKSVDIGPNADFSRGLNSELLEPIDLLNWILVYTKNDFKTAESFEKTIISASSTTGMRVSPPKRVELPNDRNETYLNAIRSEVQNKNVQMVVTIFPTLRDDRYSAIKRFLCSELPCPSQCINSKTLRNEAKNRSICQKILLQMNCKLGGTLWSIKIPLKETMIVGIDTYHEANQQGITVGGLVATMNSQFTKYFSRSVIQKKREELINGLVVAMTHALGCYKELNNSLPERIIVFRDGVGDGQIQYVSTYEVPQFKLACEKFQPNYSPAITFIVVSKRINLKFFRFVNDPDEKKSLLNPPPGSVLDSTVTRRNMYDFYLCSQNVREGTTTPSHYLVIKDENNFPPDVVQRLSYKLAYLYYNWPGAVRVPAPCQYAHKLSLLVGTAIKEQVDESLLKKLFYL